MVKKGRTRVTEKQTNSRRIFLKKLDQELSGVMGDAAVLAVVGNSRLKEFVDRVNSVEERLEILALDFELDAPENQLDLVELRKTHSSIRRVRSKVQAILQQLYGSVGENTSLEGDPNAQIYDSVETQRTMDNWTRLLGFTAETQSDLDQVSRLLAPSLDSSVPTPVEWLARHSAVNSEAYLKDQSATEDPASGYSVSSPSFHAQEWETQNEETPKTIRFPAESSPARRQRLRFNRQRQQSPPTMATGTDVINSENPTRPSVLAEADSGTGDRTIPSITLTIPRPSTPGSGVNERLSDNIFDRSWLDLASP